MKVQEYGFLNSSKKISQIGNGSLNLHAGCYETCESVIFVKLIILIGVLQERYCETYY
ncbi:MAG: hypothetical protein XE05_1886 [Thermotogales bacterium 46_20]|jgi:hypothetical protein|nr:MAG: hypothetical protein XE05_1886 [Thermotogales bacterium 46_20]